MVIGYEQSSLARGGVGGLLLAARQGGDWKFVGSVGTGFKERDATYLKQMLDKLKTKRPVVTIKVLVSTQN